MAITLPRAALCLGLTLALVGCAADAYPSATMATMGPALTVTSADFVAGGELDARHSANAWGQCSGENLNPQLSWEGAPEGTVAYAITMRDLSARNYSHWVHVNIPADVTSVATGGSADLPGVAGRSAASTVGYFGPCPPGPDHRYEFMVWALDTEIDLPADFAYPEFWTASQGHVLALGSIVGTYSPTS